MAMLGLLLRVLLVILLVRALWRLAVGVMEGARASGQVGGSRPPRRTNQQAVPLSPIRPKPLCLPACQTAKTAPCGSFRTAIRPASGTSIGGARTAPPSSVAFATVASQSAVAT